MSELKLICFITINVNLTFVNERKKLLGLKNDCIINYMQRSDYQNVGDWWKGSQWEQSSMYSSFICCHLLVKLLLDSKCQENEEVILKGLHWELWVEFQAQNFIFTNYTHKSTLHFVIKKFKSILFGSFIQI